MSDTQENPQKKDRFIQETLLEFVQVDDGKLVLREAKNQDEVLVSIDFSEKIKDMLGEDARYIGEHMIHAAMAAVMHRQVDRWHAMIHDEEPVHYS